MSTRRQRSKGKTQTSLLAEQLPGYRIGTKIGSTAWEIWRGLDYICLLQVNTSQRWAATHNMCLPETSNRFEHKTALEAVQQYQAVRSA